MVRPGTQLYACMEKLTSLQMAVDMHTRGIGVMILFDRLCNGHLGNPDFSQKEVLRAEAFKKALSDSLNQQFSGDINGRNKDFAARFFTSICTNDPHFWNNHFFKILHNDKYLSCGVSLCRTDLSVGLVAFFDLASCVANLMLNFSHQDYDLIDYLGSTLDEWHALAAHKR